MALRLYVQYCHIEDLDSFEPEVAAALRKSPNHYLFKNGVKYKLNLQGYVDRIDAFLCAHPEPENPSISEPNKEKHKAKFIPPRKNQLLFNFLPQTTEEKGRSTDVLRTKMSMGTKIKKTLSENMQDETTQNKKLKHRLNHK